MKSKAAFIVIFIAACGGGSGKKAGLPDASTAGMPPSAVRACDKAAAAPCGGNPVGTWRLDGVCDRGMSEQQVIEEYSENFGEGLELCGVSADVPITGYVKFRPDMTFQIDEIDGVAIGYSEECLSRIGKKCADLAAYSRSDAGTPAKKKCASVDGICQCSMTEESDPGAGSYTFDSDSYQLYDEDGEEMGMRKFCIRGDVFSVFAPEETIGGGGVAVAVRMEDTITDLNIPIIFPKFDGGAIDAFRPGDAPRADAAPDKPAPDASAEKPRPDAQADAAACGITNPCANDVDCPTGLTCQKFASVDGKATSSMICMPTQCTSCGKRACVVNTKSCAFVECRSDDAGVSDAKNPVPDSASIDATPVALSDMPPSMAATCQKAASAPCGGDLTGDWEVSGICDKWLGLAEFLKLYGGSCSTWGDYDDGGEAYFRNDGSCYLREYGVYTIDISESCLEQGNSSCEAANQILKKAVENKDMTAGSCAMSGNDNCRCQKALETPYRCKYAIAGNSITMNYENGYNWGPNPYCVQGDALTIFFEPWSAVGQSIGGKAQFVLRKKAPSADAGTDAK